MHRADQDSEENLSADIEQFATHDRKGGWALALLVARRVLPDEKNAAQEAQEALAAPHGHEGFRRVTAREFGQRAGTAAKRITAFRDAWKRAARDGVVPPIPALAPGIFVELPDESQIPFFGENGYYRAYEACEISGDRVHAIEREALAAGLKPTASVYVVKNPRALRVAVLADETSRIAARAALDEYDRRTSADQAGREQTFERAASRQAAADQADRGAARETTRGREDDYEAEHERAGALETVRASRAAEAEADAPFEVFNEVTQVRLRTLRALTLLQQHQVVFSEQRAATIAELCDSASAALAFIRDLATTSRAALSDDALRAFLEESERL